LVRSAVTTISGGVVSDASGSGAAAGAGAAGASAADAFAGQAAAINARMETLADPTYRFFMITLSPNLGRSLIGRACQRLFPSPHPHALPSARCIAGLTARRLFRQHAASSRRTPRQSPCDSPINVHEVRAGDNAAKFDPQRPLASSSGIPTPTRTPHRTHPVERDGSAEQRNAIVTGATKRVATRRNSIGQSLRVSHARKFAVPARPQPPLQCHCARWNKT